ncbi:hypothetical protein ACWDAG_08970 [Streptomyces sp. NPDC001157]
MNAEGPDSFREFVDSRSSALVNDPGLKSGAVDCAPRRHNSHALARMLRELFRTA